MVTCSTDPHPHLRIALLTDRGLGHDPHQVRLRRAARRRHGGRLVLDVSSHQRRAQRRASFIRGIRRQIEAGTMLRK